MWCFIFDIQRCTQHDVIALTFQLESLQFSMFVRPRLSVCALVVGIYCRLQRYASRWRQVTKSLNDYFNRFIQNAGWFRNKNYLLNQFVQKTLNYLRTKHHCLCVEAGLFLLCLLVFFIGEAKTDSNCLKYNHLVSKM